jgi:hypothetical protein
MPSRSLVTRLAILALPPLVAACPAEPSGNVVPPPQPTGAPAVTASAAAGASAAASAPLPAFENPGGMWMPEQMPLHAATLKSLGLQIEPSALADLTTAPLGAVVSLGGCTGSFVSPDGLAVTNFHCVSRWLAQASAPPKDLQAEGVIARTRAEEVWAGPSARTYVLHSIRDVTAEVREGLEAIKDEAPRLRALEAHTKKLVAACEKDRPQVRCNVASFFGGGAFRLMEQLELKDVRLVFAPPAGMGRFGGEVDNWRWPRHSGDFAFFRVYTGKDGQPAAHAESNVPYKPKHHLSWASSPLRAGELAIVAGYPGSTGRLKVAAEVEEAATKGLPMRIDSYQAFLSLLEGFAAKSKELKIRTSSQMQGLSNGLIKTRGVVEALTKGGRIEDRKKAEAELAAFIAADPARKAAWGGVIEEITAKVEDKKKHRERDAALRDVLATPRLFASAFFIVRAAEERAKPDAERLPAFQERNYKTFADSTASLQKSYDREVEAAVLDLAIQRMGKLDAAQWPKWLSPRYLGKVTDEDRKKRALDLYQKTKLEDVELRKKLLTTASMAELKKLKDPLIDLAMAALPDEKAMRDRDDAFAGAALILAPKYAEASRAFAKSKGKADIAPDANGTLRLTFGTVRGYKPRSDAPAYTPFSTLAELIRKNTGKEPFNLPQALLDAEKQNRKGAYLFGDIGDVPVDFLTDLDITGGNSGSPTLNAKGEIVGLAFDGTYEGVASDWLFLPETTRTIHVDGRYILWVLDAVFGDTELLKELRRTPAFAK